MNNTYLSSYQNSLSGEHNQIAVVKNPKILAVDDEPVNIDILKEILASDYNLEIALNGRECLEKAEVFRPDILLLDIMLPDIDGYEICRTIKSDPKHKFTKIIFLSGKVLLEERLCGYQSGADEYIIKPFDEEEIKAKIDIFLRIKGMEDNLLRTNINLEAMLQTRSDQLVETEKMAALGYHTAGIVHNMNNLLSIILGYAEILEREQPNNPNVQWILKTSRQINDMTTTILTTSHKINNNQVNNIDINELIRHKLELYKTNKIFKHNVEVIEELGEIPFIYGIYSHFSQSLNNIIKNAIEAMHDSKNKRLTVTTYKKDGNIFIKISDTGHGIAKEDLASIFQPFYTTKPQISENNRPVGTGLGLSSCHEILSCYNATIEVESTINKGTTFVVTIPIKEENTDF